MCFGHDLVQSRFQTKIGCIWYSIFVSDRINVQILLVEHVERYSMYADFDLMQRADLRKKLNVHEQCFLRNIMVYYISEYFNW